MASTFLVWLAGSLGSIAAIRNAKRCLVGSRYILCAVLIAAAGSPWLVQSFTGEETALADDLLANAPVGVAKGVNPGRVVWAHDPDATDWSGPGKGCWWEPDHTSRAAVDRMMSGALQALSGETSDAAAWDRLFRHFNQTRGRSGVGYVPGQKIAIKVNFVGCIQVWSRSEPTQPGDLDLRARNYMNTSPQMMVALVRQLVENVGVEEHNITIGDPTSYFPNEYFDICNGAFPKVHYLDYVGLFGRTRARKSSVPLYWSTPESATLETDHLPVSYVEAEYLINLANLKSHNDYAGVTLCAKNHYGSLIRRPTRVEGYYDMHKNLPFVTPGMGHYRPLVDLMGHEQLGGKTVLYLIDGLYAGKHAKEDFPRRWSSPPFNGDWTSSLFASQDPVAIDSVGFDFLYTEWNDAPHKSGTTDYMVEAALANNPPSGTFYDPDHTGNVERLASLGVHEHWNNSTDKQYSRNLGTGDGIELVKLTSSGGRLTVD